MRTAPRDRSQRRSRHRYFVEGLRAAVAAAGIAAILALILFSGAGERVAQMIRTVSSEPPPSVSHAQLAALYRVGSIVFVPVKGNLCEVRRFDNLTGRIVAFGTARCDVVLPHEARNNPEWPGSDRSSRVEAILQTFKK